LAGRSAAGIRGGIRSIAGEAIERAISREDGLEILVHLDHDETVAVVQADDVAFAPGDRVQVLFGQDGSARVQPI
jgi:outer membrane lipoprotein SlyB